MIVGASLVLARVSNIVIHNIGVGRVKNGDDIHMYLGCHKIWVDHITSQGEPQGNDLGLVTALQGSSLITVSNGVFQDPKFVMLLGGLDQDHMDKSMQVTVFRNWFNSSNQRMSHCRWGYCHVVNNLYTSKGIRQGAVRSQRIHSKKEERNNTMGL